MQSARRWVQVKMKYGDTPTHAGGTLLAGEWRMKSELSEPSKKSSIIRNGICIAQNLRRRKVRRDHKVLDKEGDTREFVVVISEGITALINKKLGSENRSIV